MIIVKKPKIRFKGFTETWEQRKLGEVFNERTERAKGNEELLSVTINNGVIRQIDSDKRNIASEDKSNYKIVQIGDVPYNSMRMWQGAVGNSEYNGIVSPAYTVLVPSTNADSKFFVELFKKNSTLNIFQRWSQGLTSDTWNLKYPILSKIEFYMPMIDEQKKIGSLFSKLDNLITLHQRKCENLKKLKKFMLQKLFPQNGDNVPEIRFFNFTDTWEQRKLNDISEVRDGTHDSPKYQNTGHPFVTSKNIKDGFINYDDIQFISDEDFNEINKRSKVDVNDILMGMIGTIGNTALIRTEPDFAIKNVALIKDTKQINYLYLYHFLHSPFIGKQLSSGMDGGTQKFVSLGNVRNLDIVYPSEVEQIKLGEYFDHLDHLITLHQSKCDKLKEVKKYMLQNMFI